MLIIFDIDVGSTLCDTHDVDVRCHVAAVESITGCSPRIIESAVQDRA